MLDALRTQGWQIEHTDDNVIVITACFEDGFWSHVTIYPNAVYKRDHPKDERIGAEAYIVTSITVHRLTNPYNEVSVAGTADNLKAAEQIAYDACQYWFNRFDSFCPD